MTWQIGESRIWKKVKKKRLWINLRQNCDTCLEGIRETTKCHNTVADPGSRMNSVPANYEAKLIGIDQNFNRIKCWHRLFEGTCFCHLQEYYFVIFNHQRKHTHAVLIMYYLRYLVFNYKVISKGVSNAQFHNMIYAPHK